MMSNVILKALRQVVHSLETLNVQYCLFGGLAMQAYKRIRSTLDIDLILGLKSRELGSLMPALEKRDFFWHKKSIQKIHPFEWTRGFFLDDHSQLEIPIDFFSATTDFQSGILNRRVSTEIFGLKVFIASCEDLILLKLLSDRPLDRADTQFLLEENRKNLDEQYLKKWSKHFGFGSKFHHLWKKSLKISYENT